MFWHNTKDLLVPDNNAKNLINVLVFYIENMQKNIKKSAYSVQVYACQVIKCT